mgnify:CR=1 FL=1|jgi:phosphatidate phosphatase LPIN
MELIFVSELVEYEDFCEHPGDILKSPDLVVKIEKKYYDWETAAPILMSHLVFKAPILPNVLGASLNEIYTRDLIYEEVPEIVT